MTSAGHVWGTCQKWFWLKIFWYTQCNFLKIDVFQCRKLWLSVKDYDFQAYIRPKSFGSKPLQTCSPDMSWCHKHNILSGTISWGWSGPGYLWGRPPVANLGRFTSGVPPGGQFRQKFFGNAATVTNLGSLIREGPWFLPWNFSCPKAPPAECVVLWSPMKHNELEAFPEDWFGQLSLSKQILAFFAKQSKFNPTEQSKWSLDLPSQIEAPKTSNQIHQWWLSVRVLDMIHVQLRNRPHYLS